MLGKLLTQKAGKAKALQIGLRIPGTRHGTSPGTNPGILPGITLGTRGILPKSGEKEHRGITIIPKARAQTEAKITVIFMTIPETTAKAKAKTNY